MSHFLRTDWQEIPDFPNYEVHPMGAVRIKKTRILWSTFMIGKSESVQLTKDGKRYTRTLRSLIRGTFV